MLGVPDFSTLKRINTNPKAETLEMDTHDLRLRMRENPFVTSGMCYSCGVPAVSQLKKIRTRRRGGECEHTSLFVISIPSSRGTVPTGYIYVLPGQSGWSR